MVKLVLISFIDWSKYMCIDEIKDEINGFINKLYGALEMNLCSCESIDEVKYYLEEEYINISDYRNRIIYELLNHANNSLENKCSVDDISKTIEELEKDFEKILITKADIDENRIYEEQIIDNSVIEDKIENLPVKESQNKKSIKPLLVVGGILLGSLAGFFIMKGIFNSIIMGFIGAAFGYGAYEMYFSKDDESYEMVIKNRIISKKIDKEYIKQYVSDRKKYIVEIFNNYLEICITELNKQAQ